MAKIAFTSDLHVSKELLRITECLNFLDYFFSYCREHDIHHAVLGGDIFHTSNSVRNQSFLPVFNRLLEASKEIQLYIFPGNHDLMTRDLDNSNNALAEAFGAFAHYIPRSETISIDGIDYDFLAYTENPGELPDNGRVLFTHLEIADFFYRPEQRSENRTFTKGSFDHYELVVSGHIHRMQQAGNIVYPGSPYSTTKAEAGDHYFCVVDGADYELIPYNEAPEYMTVTLEQAVRDKSIDYRNRIVEVVIDSKIESFVKLRALMLQKGAVSVEARFEKSAVQLEQEKKQINVSEGVAVSMVKYLKAAKAKDIDNDKLLGCFKEVLKRARRE